MTQKLVRINSGNTNGLDKWLNSERDYKVEDLYCKKISFPTLHQAVAAKFVLASDTPELVKSVEMTTDVTKLTEIVDSLTYKGQDSISDSGAMFLIIGLLQNVGTFNIGQNTVNLASSVLVDVEGDFVWCDDSFMGCGFNIDDERCDNPDEWTGKNYFGKALSIYRDWCIMYSDDTFKYKYGDGLTLDEYRDQLDEIFTRWNVQEVWTDNAECFKTMENCTFRFGAIMKNYRVFDCALINFYFGKEEYRSNRPKAETTEGERKLEQFDLPLAIEEEEQYEEEFVTTYGTTEFFDDTAETRAAIEAGKLTHIVWKNGEWCD